MLELPIAALKNNPRVPCATINGFEYILSQYADDSALILGEDQNSLEQALKIFDYFSICARLRVNLDIIEAILIDSKLSSDQNKSMRKTFSLEYF